MSKPTTKQKLRRKKALPPDLLLKVYKEILLVDGHPRLLVLVGNGFLEVLINTLVRHKLKRGEVAAADSRTYTYAVRLTLLHEAGVLTDKEFSTLDWYRSIRNRAAHEPLFYIEDQDFAALANPAYANATLLSRLTTDLVGSIWNKYAELFSPLFADRNAANHSKSA